MKKTQALQQISVATTLEAEEAVVDLLDRVFGLPAAVYINEETKLAVASVYCTKAAEWNETRRRQLAEGLELISQAGLDLGEGSIASSRVPRQDWAESWKRHFKPIAVGSKLLIKPSWIKRKPRPGQAVVILDPGLSFGTGNHPTTAFCLETLVAARRPGQAQAVWDVGTGSGILAIAAAKLGYGPIRAIDFDRAAVRVAAENARRNRVADKLSLGFGDITRSPLNGRPKYDLICANLISNLLIAERQRLLCRLRPGGTLVLAGILEREFSTVQQEMEAVGLRLTASRIAGEWRSGAFQGA